MASQILRMDNKFNQLETIDEEVERYLAVVRPRSVISLVAWWQVCMHLFTVTMSYLPIQATVVLLEINMQLQY